MASAPGPDERAEGGRKVAGILLLQGMGIDRAVIAATLGVEPAVVDRIIDTWQVKVARTA